MKKRKLFANKSYQNWLDGMNWQLDFYEKSFGGKRMYDGFDWDWYNHQKDWKESMLLNASPLVNFLRGKGFVTSKRRWFNENSRLLWNSRQLLADQLSKILFDNNILLIVVGHERYYYPYVDFDDFITILGSEAFVGDLPKDYSGLPLKIFHIRLNTEHVTPNIKIVSTESGIELLNRYRQYFIRRGEIDFSPSRGQVVFDCGACIGDISLIFAALVGKTGEVHLFDAVPLHNRYTHINSGLNPTLSRTLHINDLAVSNRSRKFLGAIKNITKISPGATLGDKVNTTSLDDYFLKNTVRQVDYIKMDIEGSEIQTLKGAASILRRFKPKLAIAAYHKHDDLWKIPELILKLNPKYKIYFGHHSPIYWESVYYAE